MKKKSEMLKLIRQVHLRFAKFFSRKILSKHLTHSQYMLLMILMDEGPQQMNSLAEFLRISTPAITNLVDKLEESGYARRTPHPTDRRVSIIGLTPDGERLVENMRAECFKLLADTIGNMPDSEQKVIEKFHGNLIARLDKALEIKDCPGRKPIS